MQTELAAGLPVHLGWWRSDANGQPANGGLDYTAARPGLIQEIPGPLQLCRHGFHATSAPGEWRGERWWAVALSGEVQTDSSKAAALRRIILEEISK